MEVITARAETMAHDPMHREGYDVVLSRGVARLAVLAELTLPFCRLGGVTVAQKGRGIDDEIRQAGTAIAAMGGRLVEVVKRGGGRSSRGWCAGGAGEGGPDAGAVPSAARDSRQASAMSLDADNERQLVRLRRRVFSLPTLLSFVLAIAIIYLLATRFDVDWSKTWDGVRHMNVLLYLLALGLYYLSFGVRGLRWRMLARNAGIFDFPNARLPSVLRFSQLIIIGWFVNAVAWLRLGDPYRAYELSRESRSGFAWSLGTVLAERVMDMAAVLALVLTAVAWYSLTRESAGTGSYSAGRRCHDRRPRGIPGIDEGVR